MPSRETEHRDRWQSMLPSVPWPERRRALQSLFEGIAPSYDRLNRFLSFGIDLRWRDRAAREAVAGAEAGVLLDLASGTGDQVAALLKWTTDSTIVRLDLSPSLLQRGARKLPKGRSLPGVVAEMEGLPLRPGSVRAITMAFALRHIDSLDRLVRACRDVLCAGGRLAFVDMALPEGGGWGRLYRFYFRYCLPRLAQLFGGEREAYDLLVRSVESFPGWDALAAAASGAGFIEIRRIELTGGAACVFTAHKPYADTAEEGGSTT